MVPQFHQNSKAGKVRQVRTELRGLLCVGDRWASAESATVPVTGGSRCRRSRRTGLVSRTPPSRVMRRRYAVNASRNDGGQSRSVSKTVLPSPATASLATRNVFDRPRPSTFSPRASVSSSLVLVLSVLHESAETCFSAIQCLRSVRQNRLMLSKERVEPRVARDASESYVRRRVTLEAPR
jgi:hypothetical protein